MKTLVTCLILTVFAVCNASSLNQQLIEKLNWINPSDTPYTSIREAMNDVIELAEQTIASMIGFTGNEFCYEEHIDWEEAWNETVALNAAIDVEAETFCSLVTNHIEEVLEPFWKRLDQCGRAHSSGPLGRSMVLAVKSAVEHVCSVTGDQIFEHFNLCAFKGTFTAPQCKQFKHKMTTLSPGQTTDTYVNELCRTLPFGKNCLMDEIGQNCELDFTKKAWEDLLNAIMSPCSGIH